MVNKTNIIFMRQLVALPVLGQTESEKFSTPENW